MIFGSVRDVGTLLHMGRELVQDIVEQEILLYKVNLEETLDNISQGKEDRIDFLDKFYKDLEQDIARVDTKANNNFKENKEEKICEQCGARMIIKKGPYSLFWACSNYPKCKYTESMHKIKNF